MKADVTTLEAANAGTVELADAIFGLEPRPDLLHRMVRYQQRSGWRARTTRRTARRSTSPARRCASRRVPAAPATATSRCRSGAAAARRSPKPRGHAIDLPKKVRALALRHALSAKAKAGEIVVLDKASSDGKTGALKRQFEKLDLTNALIIDGAELEATFARAARNIPNIDVLPVQGINVYDILRRKLVLTKAALEALEARFADAKTNGRAAA